MEEVGLDDLAMNKGAGKSGRKTAMDYALDAGNNLGEEARDKKAQVLAYLQENGEATRATSRATLFNGSTSVGVGEGESQRLEGVGGPVLGKGFPRSLSGVRLVP